MDVICGTSKHAVRIAQELSKARHLVLGLVSFCHEPLRCLIT